MKANAPIIHQFAGTGLSGLLRLKRSYLTPAFSYEDDPFIPIEEMHQIRDALNLSSTYHELPHGDHFMSRQFPELRDVIVSILE